MFFEKKLERAIEKQRSQNEKKFGKINNDMDIDTIDSTDSTEVPDTDSKRKYPDEDFVLDEPIERKDILAIIISASLMLGPIILIILGLYVVIALWFFG